MAIEKRDVHDFDRVRMQDFGALHIQQAAVESLTLEADSDLDKVLTEVRDGVLILRVGRDWVERLEVGLQTSLTRPRITYRLTVKQLSGLEVAGAGDVQVGDLHSARLSVALMGAASIQLSALTSEKLQVHLSGAGQVEAAGKVQELEVHLSGVGSYEGRKLQSEKAVVRLSGAGSATVWVEQELETHLSGIGSVEYYGQPKVTQRTSGLGSIHRAGDVPKGGIPRPPKPTVFR